MRLPTLNECCFQVHRRQWVRNAVTLLLTFVLLARIASAAETQTGEKVFQQKCASCHGAAGEGTSKNYPQPLVGDLSIGELTRYIEKTMPEDKPGTCVGEEAARVAEFIHGAFYSPTAQARNKPARIELSRLTVRQYRNAVADLIGSFRQGAKPEGQQGLRGEYFKSRRHNGKDRAIERIDPVVAFNFEDKSPDAEKMEPHEFSIRWEGSVQAPETGEYEFIVRTDQSMRLWVNDLSTPLIDAYVRSGSGTEYSQTLFLLGGRSYSLKLEFSKAKQGVNDKKAKEKPPAKAMISLEWKRAHRVAEVIPARQLSPGRFPETFVVTAPFPPDDRSIGYERGTTISKEWDQATT
ncbi:MAG: c-type cytochrome, partial [Candidatus Saccharimonas sp.]|nr:c-type cytochrome [Planctomycetaceae bacterium]